MMKAADQAFVTPLTGAEKMAGQGIGKRRFLFLMWDGAGGTIVEARIARQLLRRGHEVTVLGPATIESELRSLGCGYVLDHAMAPCSALRDAPPDELAWLRDHLWLGPARAYAHEVVATVAEVRADAVVTSGYLYGGMVGAQAAGLPAAALCTSLYGMPYRARELPAGDARRDFWEVGLKALNDARISLGLPELASVFAQRDALERLLLLTIAARDDMDLQLPANARYVGPPLEEAAAESALIKPGTRPIVLVSFPRATRARARSYKPCSTYYSGILTISCKELPHAYLCLRLVDLGAVRHRLGSYCLAFPPASPGSPSGRTQGLAAAETAYAL